MAATSVLTINEKTCQEKYPKKDSRLYGNARGGKASLRTLAPGNYFLPTTTSMYVESHIT